MDVAINNRLKALREELNLEEGDESVYTHLRELILDGTVIKTLTPQDGDLLAKFKNLAKLSLNGTGLTSLTNFPEMRSLKVLEMTDNYLTDTVIFSMIPNLFPNLSMLHLGGNHLKTIEDVHMLRPMKHLVALGLAMNPLASAENYREAIFSALPNLQSLDQVDHSGAERHVDSDAEYYDEDEEDDEEEGDDVLKKFYEADYNSDDDQNDEEFVPDDGQEEEEDFYEDEEEEEADDDDYAENGDGTSSSSSKRLREESDDEADHKKVAH
ncbi:Acidic leucine-rich nuclear phosphoprotein 32-related protein [Babesia bigemina]|uniref:Acidic leucine-rich nuclear phosphoprotein 32-related protein n=1 Tax=Babesia bigemina TaxID=5866 RepID=A0A061D577_BABBI|nr:Acidic leucine-rich nuclear phosphoprotein 32-related protein [Babesia bigemina]CDR95718.1 Acidic leucine-rich nuclear phosphoprotein 32-related protein [Babesia bigemina]|eukprot:XP_012767904.1 Acidic leucine-rich nuclear phosphoprotein 32-related protein [Babesia bigemina]